MTLGSFSHKIATTSLANCRQHRFLSSYVWVTLLSIKSISVWSTASLFACTSHPQCFVRILKWISQRFLKTAKAIVVNVGAFQASRESETEGHGFEYRPCRKIVLKIGSQFGLPVSHDYATVAIDGWKYKNFWLMKLSIFITFRSTNSVLKYRAKGHRTA